MSSVLSLISNGVRLRGRVTENKYCLWMGETHATTRKSNKQLPGSPAALAESNILQRARHGTVHASEHRIASDGVSKQNKAHPCSHIGRCRHAEPPSVQIRHGMS